MVPLLLWLINKKFPGWLKIFAACLCVAGMYLLTSEEISDSSALGDTLTVICALTFAIQVVIISRFTKNSDPIVLSFAEFLSFAFFALISSLIFETRTSLLDFESLPELLFTIIFATFGCYVMQIWAQKYAEPSHATLIMSLESVFGLLSSIYFLNEKITLTAAIGCALIFAAVLISEFERS